MRRLTSFLFLATRLLRHVREGALEHRRHRRHRRRARDPASSSRSLVTTTRSRVPRTTAVLLGFFAVFLRRLPRRLLRPLRLRRARAVGEGADEVGDPLRLPRGRRRLALAARAARTSGGRSAWFSAGIVVNAVYGVLQLLDARRGGNLDAIGALADHRRREPDQRLRRDQRRERLPAERADRRSESPRDHADRAAARS